MSNFIEMLKSNIQHRNSVLDKSNELLMHGQAMLQVLCDEFSQCDYRWERYGQESKLTGYQAGPRGWMGYKWQYIVEILKSPYPGRVLVKKWDHTNSEAACNLVNVTDKAGLEQHIREAVTQWHTEGKYL